MIIVIPSAIQLFAWLTTLVTGTPDFQTPLLWIVGFIVFFIVGGLSRGHVRRDPVRPAGDRHLLRRRPLPLRDLRRRRLPAARRLLLLVPEGHRADVPRGRRQALVLARLRRHRADVHADAHARADRDAAAPVDLSGRSRLGDGQPDRHARLLPARPRACCSSPPTWSSAASAARAWGATRSTARRSSGPPPRPRRPTTSRSSRTISSPYPMWDEQDREEDERRVPAASSCSPAGTRRRPPPSSTASSTRCSTCPRTRPGRSRSRSCSRSCSCSCSPATGRPRSSSPALGRGGRVAGTCARATPSARGRAMPNGWWGMAILMAAR